MHNIHLVGKVRRLLTASWCVVTRLNPFSYPLTFSLPAENVAKGKQAYQSSDYASYTLAAKAVDGNSDGRWGSRSCACTKKEEKAWWAVDLGSSKLVYRVDVTNRADCCRK